MARKGPPPKPTKLKLLHGSDQPLNPDEPMPPAPPTHPDPPGWLNAEARQAWQEVVPELFTLGLLTIVDIHALARYCVVHARWVEAEKWLNIHAAVYAVREADVIGKGGKVITQGKVKYLAQVPQVSIARNSARLAASLGSEFGLSPSARTRIHGALSGKTQEQDDDAVFFSKRSG